MEKDFISYDRALRMKALGFDEPCFGYYVLETNGDYKLYDKCEVKTYFTYILAPTFSQAFRWFREEHDLWSTLSYDEDDSGKILWGIDAFEYGIGPLFFLEEYDTYEEAELACLDKLLEIVESKSE